MEPVVGCKFRVGRKVGSGSFGEVFVGYDWITGQEVAIKMEPIGSSRPQLVYESKVYRILAGGVGVPAIHWHGVEGGFNVMVIDLLGPSLEDLLGLCSGKFSLKTVIMLADQMLNRAEYLHAKNFVHRDIKPDNFLIGLGSKATQVQMIDFGLSKRYRDHKTLTHIPYAENRPFVGNARYASVNAHLGIEHSRRDDLEAIGYVLVYFIRGNLPWQGLTDSSKNRKYEKVKDAKNSIPVEALCKNLPVEFATYIGYCRNLSFEERPNYTYLRHLLTSLFFQSSFEYDSVFDWTILTLACKQDPLSNMSTTDEERRAEHGT